MNAKDAMRGKTLIGQNKFGVSVTPHGVAARRLPEAIKNTHVAALGD